MQLKNLARIVLSAGTISLFAAQPANAHVQDLETRVKPTQEIALMQPQQGEIKDFNVFFSDLCKRIRDWESYYEQAKEGSPRYRRMEIVKYIQNDIRQLLARYGVDLAVESSTLSYAYSIKDGFIFYFSEHNKYPGSESTVTFRNDDTATIDLRYYLGMEQNQGGQKYFVKLKPSKTMPQPLNNFFGGMQQDNGFFHYFAKDDFDEAYRIIRELNEESAKLDTRDFKHESLWFKEFYIAADFRETYGINIYFYETKMFASSGRILVKFREPNMDNSLHRNLDLVIFPNRTTLTVNYPDGKFDPPIQLPQVMRSYSR